jgi:serine/threonine protein phosphatase PrpC
LGEFISKAVSFLFPAFINYILIEDNLNKKKQDINDMILNLFKLEESPKDVKDIFILRYITDRFKINYNYYPFLSGNMHLLSKLLYESCYYIQKELIQRYHYEIDYSGTALCSGFLLGKTLYISNVGDSRAILCKFDSNYNKWSYNQLSLDHIPSSPGENKRILANNGKIQRIKNELGEEFGPLRIYEKDNDNMLPGISMSRSIGDIAAEKLGVTFEPELFKFDLGIEDKAIIIGSDGFWAYLNNEEVIDIVSHYYVDGMRAEEMSIKMAEIAKDKWIEENKKNPSWYNYNHIHNLGIGNSNRKKNKKESLSDFNISLNYEPQKEKKYFYDDITCMIIFLEIK